MIYLIQKKKTTRDQIHFAIFNDTVIVKSEAVVGGFRYAAVWVC
jgi:hypothetical protein